MAFDLITAIIFFLVGLIVAIPVIISLINLIIEIWISYKDGKLTEEEASKIQNKRNALSRAVINFAGIFGLTLPWIKKDIIND